MKGILEALLFMSTEQQSVSCLRDLVAKGERQQAAPEEKPETTETKTEQDPLAQLKNRQSALEGEVSAGEVREALQALVGEYQNPLRGFELAEVAKGYQFRTRAAFAPYIKNLYDAPKTRLSTPGMETLAIVAYQQPMPRAKIEEIRGVDSGGVLKTLLDRDLVRIVGRSEEPGRPILYGTTQTFLELFGLESLGDLPTLKDLEALDAQQALRPAMEEEGEAVEDEEGDLAAAEEEFAAMDSESAELVGELENSMRSLNDLEKKIFEKKEEEKPNS